MQLLYNPHFLPPRHDTTWIYVWGAKFHQSMSNFDAQLGSPCHPISSQVFMYIQNIELHSKQCCQLSTFVWFESHHAGVHRVEVMCWSSSDLAAMDCEEGPGNFRQVLPRRSRFSASASQSLLACNRNTLQKRLQHEGVNFIRRYAAGS